MSLKKQRGFLTLVTVVLIVIIGFIGIALAWMTVGSTFGTSNLQDAESALFLAESGLEQALHKIYTPVLTNRVSCASLSTPITNTLDGGSYSTSLTVPPAWPFTGVIANPLYVSSPTTLNGALTAVSTTTSITVASTTNYQPFGRIMVDRELINYTSIDATHFNGITRAVDGSTLAAHATGTTVAQYQCSLGSQGGFPTLTPTNPGDPGGLRMINQNIQLQEVWTVGASNGASSSRSVTNRERETAWSNVTNALANATLNSVSMVSYTDGWAVGNATAAPAAEYIAHWNGSAWTRQAASASINNVSFFGIYCVSGTDCHAVGAGTGAPNNVPNIIHWTGAWTTITPGGATSNAQLNSVHCASASDCWAVGTRIGGVGAFYHWNGTTWTGVDVQAGANTVPNTSFAFKGVYCVSGSDCWAVGSNASFARYNGASWQTYPTGMPGVQWNGIYCNSSSDCWAVADTSGGELIGRWNGTSWSRWPVSASIKNVPLRGVTCANTDDCWIVGDNAGGGATILHWDGTTWTEQTTSLPNTALYSVDIITPKSKPFSAWQENFS